MYVCMYKHLGCEGWAPAMGGLEGFFCVWLCWLGGYGGWVTEFGGVFGGVLCTAWLTQGHPWSQWSSSHRMVTTSSRAGCTHTDARTHWDGWSRKLSWSSCTWRIGSARVIDSSSPSGDDVSADGRNDQPSASGLRDGYCFGLRANWLCFGNFCGLIQTLAGLLSWQPVSGLCRLWRKWTSQDGVREGRLSCGTSTGRFWNARGSQDQGRPETHDARSFAAWRRVWSGPHPQHRLECPSHRLCIGHIMCNLRVAAVRMCSCCERPMARRVWAQASSGLSMSGMSAEDDVHSSDFEEEAATAGGRGRTTRIWEVPRGPPPPVRVNEPEEVREQPAHAVWRRPFHRGCRQR